MTNIEHHILALQRVSKQLEPDFKERDNYLKMIGEFANNFLEDLDNLPAYNPELEKSERLKIKGQPRSIKQLIEIYKEEISEKGINPASGGHLGYIPGGGLYLSALADYLVAVTNDYVGMHFSSPGGVAIEHETLNWLKQLFGFPENAVGNLTSGGSIANLIALTAARDKHGIKNDIITNSVIYLSEQVHHCIQKSLRIIGLEDVRLHYLKIDERSRINVKDFEQQLSNDLKNKLNPFLVIASAGTTDTGAIDPLSEIGIMAKAHNLWYHIDGAYGGFFIMVDEKKDALRGIESADSLVIDPHKGLFLPYGTGAVLIKDREAVFKSHVYRANYMQDATKDNPILNPADVSPELSKHFRALRMWLPLQFHGTQPFIACLKEKLLLTTYFRKLLFDNGFLIGPEPDLSVSYFWYPFKNYDDNKGNAQLLDLLHKDGEVFFSSTMIKERLVIRIAILSFRTKLETIDRAMTMILRCLKKVEFNL